MPISQETIDLHGAGTILKNNPNGGGGDDYSEYCLVLNDPIFEDKNLLWKPDDYTSDDSPLCHHVGINCPRGYNIAWELITTLYHSFYVELPLNGEFGRVVGIGFINLRGDSDAVHVNIADSQEDPWIWEGIGDNGESALPTSGATSTVEAKYYSLPGNIQTDAIYFRSGYDGNISNIVIYAIYDPRDNVITCSPVASEDFTISTDGVWESISFRCLDKTYYEIDSLKINGEYVMEDRDRVYNAKPSYVHYSMMESQFQDEANRTLNKNSDNRLVLSSSNAKYEIQLSMVARSELSISLSTLLLNLNSSLNNTPLRANAPNKVLMKANATATESEPVNTETETEEADKPHVDTLADIINGYSQSDKTNIVNCITNKKKELIELIKKYESDFNIIFTKKTPIEQLGIIRSLCTNELK